jgi:hypothetical protein
LEYFTLTVSLRQISGNARSHAGGGI